MAVRLVARRDLKEIFPKEFSNRTLIGKFIDYIMNNFFQASSEENINGFIGKKTVAMEEGDFYLTEATAERQAYQLTPTLVSNNPVTGETITAVDYCNFINTLKQQGCDINDQNRLLSNEYWSWCPPINVDMFLNYNFYYWIEEGPTPIELTSETNITLNILGKKHYTYKTENEEIEFISGLRVIFKNDVNPEFNDKPYIIEGVGQSIQLIDDTDILKGKTKAPEYFIMERGCRDGNTWSLRNRWFHRSVIGKMTNNDGLTITQASKPIICFNRDIKLYDYGVYNRGYVDLLYNGKKSNIHGLPPATIQGVKIEDGKYILITGDPEPANNNKIYQVTGVSTIGTVILQPVINGLNHTTGEPVGGEGITVREGDWIYGGQYFYYKDYGEWGEWVNGQKKLSDNQSPLFQLYDSNMVELNNSVDYPQSTFKGSRIFDYMTPADAGIEDESGLVTDPDLEKKIVTNGYGNYIFNNVLDNENYTYTEYDVTKEYEGFKFYKINKIDNLDSEGKLDDSQSEYLNCWHISKNITSQYITTEITVTNEREYKEIGEEGGMIVNYTKYNLAYSPDESSSQVTSYVYLNGNLLNKDIDYKIDNKALYITNNVQLKVDDSIYIKLLVTKIDGELADGYFYDLPLSLTANGMNGDITTITFNEIYDQFKSIIEGQTDFMGDSNGLNNYINTKQDLSVGTEILQHSNPILKTMLMNSQQYSNIRNVLEFVTKSYTNFKIKFRTTLETMVNDGSINEETNPSTAVRNILSRINIGKEGLKPFYNNGVMYDGIEYYIPSTPAYLGIDKSYKPEISVLESSPNKPYVLICHDGSYEETYGDFRDSILLRIEEEIYDSINSKWKNGLPIWNNYKYIPGKFRETPYSVDEYRNFIIPFLENWVNENRLDYTDHSNYDYTDPFTFNYSTCTDQDGVQLYGSYRNIYLYYYDTFEPHLKPWEMLGFGSKPEWWEEYYGKAPYNSSNIPMWTDIENGYIADGSEKGYHKEFSRKGLVEKYLPVDSEGNLLDPIQIGIIETKPISYYASQPWAAGDMGSVETAWTFTSQYRYNLQTIMYLMRPIEWVETNWDTLDHLVLFEGTDYEQTILADTLNRPTPSEIIIHNEEKTDGRYVKKIGIQQWLADFLTEENINITSYIGSMIRNIDLQLSYRCGRYYKKDSLKIISDNYGVIPSQNYHMNLYKTITNKQASYSAIVIQKVENGYMIDGYDLANPYFNILTPILTGKKTGVEVNGRNVIYYNNWKNDIQQVKYKTIFSSVQELFNVICGYGKYLENIEGWVFNRVFEDTNEAIDFESKAKDFVRFASINPEVGQIILLNPGYEGLVIQHEGFLDTVGQYINGHWSVTDTNGDPIYNEELSVYRHNGYSEIDTKNRLFTSVKLNFIEYEHILLFDNKTIYGDVLYNSKLCVKTQRLKLMGTGVVDWDGTLYAPGYLIEENGAVPNYDKLVEDFKYFYDTDDVRSSGIFGEYAKKTIGYQVYPNMERLLVDDRNMFDFYKGLIREKGTRKSFGKLNRSRYIMTNEDNQIALFENWAFKLGDFGHNKDNYLMEFDIDAEKITQNPQIISFTTEDRTIKTKDSPMSIDIYWNDTKDNELNGTHKYWLKQLSDKYDNAFLFKDSNKIYPIGGFAQIEDVDYIVENIDIFEENKEYMKINETIWVVKEEDGDWNIYKKVEDGYIPMRVDSISQLETFNRDYLVNGDLIYVTKVNLSKNLEKFNDPHNLLKDSQNLTSKTGWAIFRYNSDSEDKIFDLYRCQNRLPDITKLNKCFIVNNDTDETLSQIQLYDPLQGIIPNDVLEEVNYITAIDPVNDYNDYYNWGDIKVGELWWDLSKVRYLDYHQGDVYYRRKNWGKQLPGSEIAIMEWTKSNIKPENGINYVEKKVWNYQTSNEEIYYYYWNKNPAEIPDVNFRSISALNISQVINSPQDEGIIWMAPIYIKEGINNLSSFIIGNFDTVSTGSDFVVQINFKTDKDLDIHSEWALVREGDDDDIPDSLWTKMRDSLIGKTSNGLLVPDKSLIGRNRLGLALRPMQTMFDDIIVARENFVDVVNDIFNNRDVTTDTDVGTKEFNKVFFDRTPLPEADLVDLYSSSDIMKTSANIEYIGKTFLITKDESFNNIWTYWIMNGYNDFTLLDYEKFNVEKYWYYEDLYYDSDAITSQPIYSALNKTQLEKKYFNDNNINVGDVFKLVDGSDWELLRVTKVTQKNTYKNTHNEVSGYVSNGIAYDKENNEVGYLITEENIYEYNTLYPYLEANINDIVGLTSVEKDGKKTTIATIIGYMVNKDVETIVIAKNDATINLKPSLYNFLNDKKLLEDDKKGIEFIDGMTEYQYLTQETETIIGLILDYFSDEIVIDDEENSEEITISEE